ncbi:MAG: hypothetical protein M3Y57_17030 [Acidobacteriota bacterium]|nr:hypothetical protein [Acidobacteriota bacterium]
MTTRPRGLRYFCLLTALTATSCSTTTPQSEPARTASLPVEWSPSLHLANLSDVPGRMNLPFGDVFTGTVNGRRATIANCSDYLRLSKQGFKDPNDQEVGVLHNDAAECVALSLLEAAKPARKTYLADFKLTPASLTLLPPELAPAVSDTQEAAAKAADSEGKSWKDYVPEAQATAGKRGSEIEVKQPGWLTKVMEYGRADFTGGGSQQLLIRVDYASTEGTYGDSKIFLLGRGTAQARLKLGQTVPVP